MKNENIEMRHEAELALWRQATEHGGGKFTLADNGKAINTVFRLNIVRRKLRQRDGETHLDMFTVALKKGDNVVVIQPRPMIEAAFAPLHDELSLETENEA